MYQNNNHPIHVSTILDKALYEMSFAFKKENLDQVNPLVKNTVQEIIERLAMFLIVYLDMLALKNKKKRLCSYVIIL